MEFSERSRIIAMLSTYYACINCQEQFHLSQFKVIDEDLSSLDVSYTCPRCKMIHTTTLYEGFPSIPYAPGELQTPPQDFNLPCNYPTGPALSADQVLEVWEFGKSLTSSKIKRLKRS